MVSIPSTTLVGLSAACDKEEEGPTTKSFEATFFTNTVSIEIDSVGATRCTPPHLGVNTQKGEGSSSEMSQFDISLSFCVFPVDFTYILAEGSFVDSSTGDEIFFEGSGQIVVPSSRAGYDGEFKDDFTITGGTGKFKGATGKLTTDSYANFTTARTDHVWSGEITY